MRRVGRATWWVARVAMLAAGTVVLTASLVACGTSSGPDTPRVTVRGTVLRGPIQPVCMVGVPCDAPFSAGFTVRQGARLVARFRSATDGSFSVEVPIGQVTITPDADAPLMFPTQQTKTVDVPPMGLSNLQLVFSTGIA